MTNQRINTTAAAAALLFVLVALVAPFAAAQDKPAASTPDKAPPAKAAIDTSPAAPKVLPGSGLAEHDFLYAGEAKDRKVFIVRKGKVAWTYDDPQGKGEISDAILLSNGNVLLAHQFAVKLVGPDQKVIWNYDAPKGTEIHTAQMIGKEHVLYVQNGDPAIVKVVNITTGATRKEFPLPVRNAKSVHGQFRHARLTSAGTLMVAHMDLAKVAEYDVEGKELWSIPAQGGAWGVTPLANGNFLIVDRTGVREVNRARESVWTWARTDLPDYRIANLQLAWRLPNGNTLINNWVNQWQGPIDKATAPVQAVELTPDKKVVWALRSWADPDLGPATTIQVLNDSDAPENVTFGDIK
ncbi:MAG: hypothetical protein JWN40_2425 [Phycisphaerales bacterium]|nr:hypothetical protein [Phycisphaerales bacterium]